MPTYDITADLALFRARAEKAQKACEEVMANQDNMTQGQIREAATRLGQADGELAAIGIFTKMLIRRFREG